MAIQKDPPARPKAMTDPNFFTSSLGGPADVKYRTVRPVYSTGPLKEDEATTTALVSRPPLPTKKSVTFAEKLFEIREYEKNPEEWTSFVSVFLSMYTLHLFNSYTGQPARTLLQHPDRDLVPTLRTHL